MEFLEQVQRDRENDVLISTVTWNKVLDTAVAQSGVNERLVAAAQKALDECVDLIATPAGDSLAAAIASAGAK